MNNVKEILKKLVLLGLLFTALGCVLPCVYLFNIWFEPPPKEENWPSWAPDSQRLVYECYLDGPIARPKGIGRFFEPGAELSFYTPEAADLCTSDINKSDQVRLTDDSGGDWHPAWSPDGSQIAYLRDDGIYLITSEGQNRRQLVAIDLSRIRVSWWRMDKGTVTWSPEGDRLLFSGCLDHQDHDVYVVDVGSSTMTNLTPNSRAHDFTPMWTLNGSKIVFLSTDSSSPYSCSPEEDALPQMKVVNVDGSDERVVYDPEFYYPYWQVSVSNGGQIVFLTNMTSRTYDEYYDYSAKQGTLYRIDLIEETPILVDWRSHIGLPVWSPNEEYVACLNYSDLAIINVGTREMLKPREDLSIENRFVWSPDGQRIAAVGSNDEYGAIDSEEHIHIFDIQSRMFQSLIQK